MKCPACETVLPGAARFCWSCGTAQTVHDEGGVLAAKPEHCEIVFEGKDSILWLAKIRFWAQALGSGGRYVAAVSDVWCTATYPGASLGHLCCQAWSARTGTVE